MSFAGFIAIINPTKPWLDCLRACITTITIRRGRPDWSAQWRQDGSPRRSSGLHRHTRVTMRKKVVAAAQGMGARRNDGGVQQCTRSVMGACAGYTQWHGCWVQRVLRWPVTCRFGSARVQPETLRWVLRLEKNKLSNEIVNLSKILDSKDEALEKLQFCIF